MEKCVPLQHPKNNLFTLKKLILIENYGVASREISDFFIYMCIIAFAKRDNLAIMVICFCPTYHFLKYTYNLCSISA